MDDRFSFIMKGGWILKHLNNEASVCWKSTNLSKASMWICDLESYLKLERIKHLMKGSV